MTEFLQIRNRQTALFPLECNRTRNKKHKSRHETNLDLYPQTWTPGLFDRPVIGVELAPHWTDRHCLTIRRADLVWRLTPSLTKAQAYELLERLEQAKILLDLNLIEGVPIVGARIHSLTGVFLSRKEVR